MTSVLEGTRTLIISRTIPEEIVALRQEVFCEHLPPEAAILDDDRDPNTFHFVLYRQTGGTLAERPSGCASVMSGRYRDRPAWRLRAMATRRHERGQGLGSQLLKHIELTLGTDMRYGRTHRLIWCDAREAAVGFYRHHGWQIVSDAFLLPHLGRHYRMSKRI